MTSNALGSLLPAPAQGAGVCAPVSAVRTQPAIDGWRVLAAFAVICLHTEPFTPERMADPTPLSDVLGWGLNVLALFAVPFFFAASGYFFGQRCRRNGPWPAARHLLARIAPLFVAWSLLYALAPGPAQLARLGLWGALERNALQLAKHAMERPLHLICNGTGMQLWFLSALCLAAVLCALLLSQRKGRWLLPAAACLFCLGLLGQGYGQALDITLPFGCNTRLGPFFGFPLFALGVWQAARPEAETSSRLLLGVGAPLLFLEAGLLCGVFGTFVSHYYLASAALALGLLRLALARPWMLGRLLPRLGLLTPGIYLLHLGLLSLYDQNQSLDASGPLGQLLLPLCLFGLCCLCTAGLRSLPLLRMLV